MNESGVGAHAMRSRLDVFEAKVAASVGVDHGLVIQPHLHVRDPAIGVIELSVVVQVGIDDAVDCGARVDARHAAAVAKNFAD